MGEDREARARRRRLAHWLAGAGPRPETGALAQDLPPDLRPLAAHRLRQSGGLAELPDALARELVRATRASGALQLGLRAETRSAVSALEAAGIPSLVLKGMALAHTVYPSPEARTMVDVDLGVPPERLPEARRVLEATGLRVPDRRRRDLEAEGDAWSGPLERPDTSRMVDLQTALKLGQPPYATHVVSEDLAPAHWERAQALELGGTTLWVPAPEDMLRHTLLHGTCMHGFQHGVRSLLDVALQIRHHGERLDLERVLADCGSFARWVRLAFALVAEEFGVPVPARLLEQRPATEEAKRLARAQLWESHDVQAPVGLLDVLIGRRAIPGLRSGEDERDASWSVGGAGREPGAGDFLRRARVLGRYLGRGQLTPRRLIRSAALRRGHWRLTELMRADG